MSKYFEVRNNNGYIQLDDTFKPMFLLRRGSFKVDDAVKRQEQIELKFNLLKNEYNVAIRNRTDTPITYYSTLVIDPKTKQRYVALEIISQDINIVENLEYYVFGVGEIIPMKKGDVGLEVRNKDGEVIYNSKTPIAKVFKSEIGCAVPTYHGNPYYQDKKECLVWDFGIFNHEGKYYMIGFAPPLNEKTREYVIRHIPFEISESEKNREWERIKDLEKRWESENHVFASRRVMGQGVRGELAIMVNRLPCLSMVREGYWLKCLGTIQLTKNEAVLTNSYLNPFAFDHLPWFVGRGVQPMYSLLALNVSGYGNLSGESGVSAGSKELKANYNYQIKDEFIVPQYVKVIKVEADGRDTFYIKVVPKMKIKVEAYLQRAPMMVTRLTTETGKAAIKPIFMYQKLSISWSKDINKHACDYDLTK